MSKIPKDRCCRFYLITSPKSANQIPNLKSCLMMSVMLAQRLDESYLAERWNGSLNVLGISGDSPFRLFPQDSLLCGFS
ncbi:hypothetical protein SLEP1_g57328 [Rubroshorea leprosula]|uniref:Uncharacterized protein n=1 Tax=Rubroshorea leprosula TaxID=152421 RepID=A0AAV5MP68_9ROSI|nr:hypothetical protein SLEP1_g57328 [Rubroshorea leprosula]